MKFVQSAAFTMALMIIGVYAADYGGSHLLFLIGDGSDEVVNMPAKTCDKSFYKLKNDCRRLIVDNHYETYKANRKDILETCNLLATRLSCVEIPDIQK